MVYFHLKKDSIIETLINTLYSWEGLAMVLAIAYLLLAIKESLWCWVAGFFSTLIYSIIFFDVSLLMDSALNVYYLFMALYGWYTWKFGGKDYENELEISSYGFFKNIIFISILAIISLIFGHFMSTYTHADFAYIDSFTTVFAIFTTFLLAKKKIENWLYWIVIDMISIYIYVQKELTLTAILFAVYTVLAFVAYYKWNQEYDKRKA